MPCEQVEEPVVLRHQSAKPSQHAYLPGDGVTLARIADGKSRLRKRQPNPKSIIPQVVPRSSALSGPAVRLDAIVRRIGASVVVAIRPGQDGERGEEAGTEICVRGQAIS